MWLCFCLHSVRTLAVNDDADDEVVPVWLCYASSLKPALYTHVFRPANLRNIAHPPPQLSLLIGKRNYIIYQHFLGSCHPHFIRLDMAIAIHDLP